MRPRLLYVEDDPAIAEMTIEVLGEHYDVSHIADGRRALDAALAQRFDVLVVDRRLPSMEGAALVRAIRTARITTPVLMLTALGAVPDRVDGLDAGANDYLVKPFDYDELLARLRALTRGFQAEGARRGLGQWTYIPESQAVYGPDGSRAALTATESALLTLLSDHPERVFSREELIAQVFTGAADAGTVDSYVHYLRRKTTTGIVETVRGRGYRAGRPE